MLKYSLVKLSQYRTPPSCRKYQKLNIKMPGAENLHAFERNFFLLNGEFFEVAGKNDNSQPGEIYPFLSSMPNNYFTDPFLFAGIHTAIMKFYGTKGLRGKKVLQIASNWNPYMHFLYQQYDANTCFLDTNEPAIDYAKKRGLNYIVGDASKMDFFQDNSFDIVVSCNFLRSAYLNIFSLNKPSNGTGFFMDNVITEIQRVLKPGGRFFSQEENMVENQSAILNQFRSLSIIDIPSFGSVDILQK